LKGFLRDELRNMVKGPKGFIARDSFWIIFSFLLKHPIYIMIIQNQTKIWDFHIKRSLINNTENPDKNNY
jgi:hypothetical protein